MSHNTPYVNRTKDWVYQPSATSGTLYKARTIGTGEDHSTGSGATTPTQSIADTDLPEYASMSGSVEKGGHTDMFFTNPGGHTNMFPTNSLPKSSPPQDSLLIPSRTHNCPSCRCQRSKFLGGINGPFTSAGLAKAVEKTITRLKAALADNLSKPGTVSDAKIDQYKDLIWRGYLQTERNDLP